MTDVEQAGAQALADLAHQAAQPDAPGWKPQPGDTIAGTIAKIGWSNEGEFGRYPIVTLELEDGSRVSVHAFHSVLRREFVQARPAVGERVAVAYLGKASKAAKGMSPAELYRVAVDRPGAGTEVWDD